MTNNNNNQRVVYLEKSDSLKIIFEILKNNGAEETVEEIYKKFQEKKEPKVTIVDRLMKDFVLEKNSFGQFILSLQKELGVTKETAEKISNDIKLKLVPLTQKIEEIEDKPEEEEETPQKLAGSEIVQKIKPPIEISKIQNSIAGQKSELPKKEFEKSLRKKIPTKIFEDVEKNDKLPKKNIQTEKPKSTSQDSYRELIG